MNKQETTQIITLLAGNYDSIANKSQLQKQMMLNTWYECLKDLDYKLVLGAVKKTIIESQYTPTIADIRKNAIDLTNPTEYNALEDWNECYKMISRGAYMTQEEFDTYNDICKKFVGSLQQLRDYAMTDCEVINTVVKSNFLKQYDIIKKRENQQKILPENMKKEINSLQNNAIKMIEGNK